MSEKINYMWPITSENAVVYNYFLQKLSSIKDILADKRIVIFGAGIRGCCLLKILESYDFRNIIFIDNNTEKQGNIINGYDIVSLDEALGSKFESIILVSTENSGAMSHQLAERGLIKDKDWFSFDVSVYDDYVAEYLRPIENHLLFVGDCAFSHISIVDEVHDSLGEMIKNKLLKNQCKILAMHGIGHKANYNILDSLLDRGEKPRLLVLLLVMETLTSKAHIMPRTQHPELMHKLVKSIQNPCKVFTDYAAEAQSRFNKFQVESFASYKKGDGDTSEKLYMKMNYLFKIREDTEGIIYLKKIIKRFNDEDIPVVLYVPPVNYMQGQRFFGLEFKRDYIKNFTKLYGFLNSENLKFGVADASFLLTENEFAAVNTIDETANYNGRVKLLDFLSENKYIKPFLD